MERSGKKLGRAFAWVGLLIAVLLFADNEAKRYFGPVGFFVDVFLSRSVVIPSLIVACAMATFAAVSGQLSTRVRTMLSLIAIAIAVLSNRQLSYSWESEELVEYYGPFQRTYRDIDSETFCVATDGVLLEFVGQGRRVVIFRGIPPWRFGIADVSPILQQRICGRE